MLITHDLGVVAEIAERVMVMYAGRKVEEAPVADLFRAPRASLHAGPARRRAQARLVARRRSRARRRNWPRFRAGCRASSSASSGCVFAEPLRARPPNLPAASRRRSKKRQRGHFAACHYAAPGSGGRMSAPLLEVNDLKKHFPVRGGSVTRAARRLCGRRRVASISTKGETLALVGESGCGKSTVGRAVLRLFDITAGQVVLDGRRIDDMPAGMLRPLRRRMQVVFQDPFSSLNPRMRVRDILAEPIRNFGLATSSADMDGARSTRCSTRSGCRAMPRGAGRTSSPAASASASASPARSPPSRT